MAYVDVIMGAYNEERTISRAIESIINQEYTNWRLLICNDGSLDNTSKILKRYTDKYDQRIVVINNDKNYGLTYSLNKLISISNAKYIARMDADDVSLPQRLKEEVKFLEKHSEFAIVGTCINKFDDNGIFSMVRFPEMPMKRDLLWNSPFAHPSVMIRSRVIKELGGYSNIPRTLRCEDYDLWFRLYQNGYKGYNIQKALLNYYESNTSYCKRKFRYRLNEAVTRFVGYKNNKLLPIGFVYVLKPIIVGIIPNKIVMNLKRKKENGR